MSKIIETQSPNTGIGIRQVKNYHIDWGHLTSQINATSVPFDSTAYISTNVHDALEEIARHTHDPKELTRHALDDSTAHIGIAGAENNLMAINQDGLPKDSGIELFVPDSTSAADINIFFRDRVRNKLLSTSKNYIWAGRKGSATNRYLENIVGTPMNLIGEPLEENSTLVGILMMNESNTITWTAEVRKNNNPAVLESLTITNQYSNSDMSKNFNFNTGDIIQVFCNGIAVPNPLVKLIFRERY